MTLGAGHKHAAGEEGRRKRRRERGEGITHDEERPRLRASNVHRVGAGPLQGVDVSAKSKRHIGTILASHKVQIKVLVGGKKSTT